MPSHFTVTVVQLCVLYTCVAHTEQIFLVFTFLVIVSPMTLVEQLLCLNRGNYEYCFYRGEEIRKDVWN